MVLQDEFGAPSPRMTNVPVGSSPKGRPEATRVNAGTGLRLIVRDPVQVGCPHGSAESLGGQVSKPSRTQLLHL